MLLFIGAPTNFGTSANLQRKWDEQIEEETGGDYLSTYRSSFEFMPRGAMVTKRYATPKQYSSIIHRANSINKDMHYRNSADLQRPQPMKEIPSIC